MNNSDKGISGPVARTKSLEKQQVCLTDEERRAINQMIVGKGLSKRELLRCKILTLCDQGKSDREIVEKVGVSSALVDSVWSRYLHGGFELAVHGLPTGQPKRHTVALTEGEKKWVKEAIESGRLTERKLKRCNILALSDQGMLDKEICQGLGVSAAVVSRVRKRYSTDGIELAVMGLPMGKSKKYQVDLTKAERGKINQVVKSGELSEMALKRSQILILSDEGKLDLDISKELEVSVSTVLSTRKRFAADGLDIAIKGLPIPGSEHMLTIEQCKQVKNIALSPPPEGVSRWTLKLLAEKFVMDGVVERVSIDTIRRALIRSGLKRLP